MALDGAWIRDRLEELCSRHQVPGATAAVVHNGELLAVGAAGVRDRHDGAAVTPETVFPLGSITKAYTATLVLQLVDEGRVELDSPIGEHLPELTFAEEAPAGAVTIRRLLTHTSGIDGDLFADTGRGDDCLARYVSACRELAFVHPPGALHSYCNAGYSLLGRLVEVLRGEVWDRVLEERLLVPMGATATTSLPERSILHAVALGHVPDASGRPVRATTWSLPRSNGPAGLLVADAADVARFAMVHLAAGVAPGGARVLSPGSVAAMQTGAVVPPADVGERYGLGWILFDGWPRDLVGHDGSTIGHTARLRLVPELGAVVVVLANTKAPGRLHDELVADVLAEFSGAAWRPTGVAGPRGAPPLATGDVVGRYARRGLDVEIEHDGGGRLRMTVDHSGDMRLSSSVARVVYRLEPTEGGTWVEASNGSRTPLVVRFLAGEDGRTTFLHTAARVFRRVASEGDEPASMRPAQS